MPYLHVALVFLYRLTFVPEVMAVVVAGFPWEPLARIEDEGFPASDTAGLLRKPLPEDYAMRGLIWAGPYFPDEWFSSHDIDDDEKYFELPSMSEDRKNVLYILVVGLRPFSASPQDDIDLGTVRYAPVESFDRSDVSIIAIVLDFSRRDGFE
ncbi:hypothetical protein B0T26DRAFT_681686 [Lasiosphaeria miniovina]|uniref:Uncharacterized protein n=1 Tax=Lasiosphaeria miniovina TaxID=1954250 RepID=A0AA39ZV40_9PEZI|nr:uncharacterized protein B0T26DRAFT_681686 [Lasiosphaeria miniovina]KAK0704080.1 hypothetical protein B0T26DRAFT_681686 [Lasiosphaeria miniovina]